MNRISKCMLAAAVLAVATNGLAQDQMQSPAVHANRGQSSAQQSRDADNCAVMARKRSGVDPTVLAANSTPLQEGKGLNIQPIDQPTMAMGSSGGGATGAGTGDMSQGGQAGTAGQMGSSGAGATGSSGGQMNPAQGGATGSSAMGGQAAGGTGSAGMAGSSSASADMGSSGSSGAAGATGAGGAAGAPGHAMAAGSSGSTGTTGAGHPAGKGRSKLAMVTADDYNAAFSKCMSSRGYTVESSASGN